MVALGAAEAQRWAAGRAPTNNLEDNIQEKPMRQRLHRWKAFIAAGIFLMALATLSDVPSATAAGHSVTKITLDPPTPNILLNNQRVTISFSYATTQPGGVQIFARPFASGSRATSYAASDAPISPTGSGMGTQFFTITSGNVTVDQIRIQMFNADQTQVLFEAFLPVHYEFRSQ